MLGADAPAALEYQSILTAVRNLPDRRDRSAEVAERHARRRSSSAASERSPLITKAFVTSSRRMSNYSTALRRGECQTFNGDNDAADRFRLLDDLLEQQCYRLAYWRVAPDEINYRRFFDINDLAALSMERQEVFEACPSPGPAIARGGKLDGLRIDHPDGLYDPAQYLLRLQESYLLACAREASQGPRRIPRPRLGPTGGALLERIRAEMERNRAPLYVVVEKILSTGESLPDSWPVHGTSGYEFINMVNGLFIETKNSEPFRHRYTRTCRGRHALLRDVVSEEAARSQCFARPANCTCLTHQLDRLAQEASQVARFHVQHVAACAPRGHRLLSGVSLVHRERRDGRSGSPAHRHRGPPRRRIRNPLLGRRVFGFIRGMLLLEYPPAFTEDESAEQRASPASFSKSPAP